MSKKITIMEELLRQSQIVVSVKKKIEDISDEIWFDELVFHEEFPLRCQKTKCYKCISKFINRTILKHYLNTYLHIFPSYQHELYAILVCIFHLGYSNSDKLIFHYRTLLTYLDKETFPFVNQDHTFRDSFKWCIVILEIRLKEVFYDSVPKLKCLASHTLAKLKTSSKLPTNCFVKSLISKIDCAQLTYKTNICENITELHISSDIKAHLINGESFQNLQDLTIWVFCK